MHKIIYGLKVTKLDHYSWKSILIQRQVLACTAPWKNMQILMFRSQLTFAFFAAVYHLSGPLRKQKFSSTVSKGCGL